MNELIKIQNNENGQAVSARDLHKALSLCKSFEEFFIKVSELKCSLDTIAELRTLRKTVELFLTKYSGDAITYLADSIDVETTLPCRQEISSEINESQMKEELLNNFTNAFPDYALIGVEVSVKGIGRIDVLAKECRCERPVIIEIKASDMNPNKQLLAYAKGYKNPILIAITKKMFPLERRLKAIAYYTLEELKEGANLWVS